MLTLEPGARVDTYRLIRPLGQGGFAEVWEAERETDGRRVALKVLTEVRADSARALERFEQEGRLAASLSSPRCVYVFDAGAWEGHPYIAMELMPGGTLAGRIEAGPLPSRQAVDCVLDVLDGLEAAQREGILHRDVKPSNVFLDADGRAKIGDFGISKSLEADSKLSQTGAFLGTPYYASPEQIAAEPLDLRSDLYSVGAMLYELVTGKLPYLGTNASQVLAQVLTRDPVPFAQTGVNVPMGLQVVILRLLAKAREKRYQTYEQARAALVPFSSRGLAPAGRPRRFAAIVIDLLLFLPVSLVGGALLVRNNFRGELAASLTLHLSQLAYFSITERYGYASLGKRLLGLRVTTVDGGGPTLGAVLARTLIFLALYAGPGVSLQAFAMHGAVGPGPLGPVLPLLVELLGFAVILAPMRAANGYAGAHDLLTKTRVMALVARERTAVVTSAVLPSGNAATDGDAFGPYRATRSTWSRPGESLGVARDETLNRDVWIHAFAAGTAVPAVEVLRDRGAGSLPWLQRGQAGPLTWDAYGAPPGIALTALARGRGLDWRQMRVVLHSLAVELRDRLARTGTAGPLTPAEVWIDPQGHALLLDFPAEAPTPAPGSGARTVTPENWREFLADVVSLGLRDRATGRAWPSAPLPEHARVLLDGLRTGAGLPPLDGFVTALERQSTRPASVTRLRRAGPLGVLAVVPLGIVALRMVIPVFMSGLPVWYQDLQINAQAYIDSLRSAERRAPDDTVAQRTAEAIGVILAYDRRQAQLTPQIGEAALQGMPPHARADVDSAARRYADADSQTVARARAWLRGRVALARLTTGWGAVPQAFTQGMKALGYLGVAGVLLALALRGGLLFTLFGIAVQRPDGTPAGRLRCLVRSLAAWGPLLALVVLSQVASPNVSLAPAGPPAGSVRVAPDRPSGRPSGRDGVLILIALGGAAFAIWRPTRGVAERLGGVVLVPK